MQHTGGNNYILISPVKGEENGGDSGPIPLLTAMKDDVDAGRGRPGGPRKGISAWGAVFVCSNACIGAGVLAFPNVFANGGLVSTFVLMFVVASLEALSLAVLVSQSQILGVTQYQEVVQKVYGAGASVFFSCIIFSYMFGALSAYLIIIGDVVTSVAQRHVGEDSIYSSYSFAILAVGTCFLLPLSLKRHFHDLQVVSFISIASLFYLLVAVLIRSLETLEQNHWHVFHEVHYLPTSFENLMNAVPVMGFAFVCHLQICEIAHELDPSSTFFGRRRVASARKPSAGAGGGRGYHRIDRASESTALLGPGADPARVSQVRRTMWRVIVGALSVCGIFYGTIGSSAYLATPKKWETISDLLQGYGVSDSLMEVGRIALVLNIVCSYPINLGPARSALMDILHKFFGNKLTDAVLSALVTAAIVAGTLLVALSVRDLGVVFKIIGGTVGAVLIFILPGLIFFHPSTASADGRRTWGDFLRGLALQIFGAALLVCTIVSYFTG